ncbi:MAG: nuclear transport factor 2 family protein, partial [Acidobacteriota bacterium]|nr:nuclear transport factor 2 family protein [Acidobacteriota bacterium]
MRRILIAALLLMAASAVCAGQAKSQKADGAKGGGAEETLRRIENDWAKATLAGDAAAVDKILAPDWTYTDSDGNVMTKADFLSGMRSGSFKATTFTLDDMKVSVYGNAAVVRAKVTMKGSFMGQTIDETDQSTDM